VAGPFLHAGRCTIATLRYHSLGDRPVAYTPHLIVPEVLKMSEIMQHLTALADEIGPRPATTDSEHRAADYICSVFVARGLEPEIQEFDAPRTYAWAYVIYHFLTIASAVVAGSWVMGGVLVWPAFAVAAIVAFFLWNDLETRWGFSRLMPKGPSQNVIARHVPKARRGERLKKVVIVAHYDTARSSLAFAPGAVHQFPLTFALMKISTIAVPVLLFASAVPLPVPADVRTYLWYGALGFAAYLLIPLLIHVHRELVMPFVAGANDNASGVAAMLGVLHNLVAEPDASRFATSSHCAPLRHTPDVAFEADVVPEGALLTYTPAGVPDQATTLPEDFAWVEPNGQPARPPQRGQGLLEFETIEFAKVAEDEEPPARAPRYADEDVERDRIGAPSPDRSTDDSSNLGAVSPRRAATTEKPKRGLLGGLGKGKRGKDDERDVKGWLGVGEGFDARKAGKEIGSWDKFGSDDDDDDDDAGGLGWKGGWAGDDPIEDDDFATNEAARIRRRVTETIDRDLSEKEVWFVATGAEEVGTVGMQAFLNQFGDEIRDALIINLDNVGAGQLSWVTAEGMARRYRADRRLVSLAKRVSREQEILVKPRVYKGLSTDATPALVRGYKAMTLMAFDSAGMPENWHWKSDTTDNIEPEVIERVTELVTHMIREA